MDIYVKYGHLCYMTGEGEMMCPPHIKTKADAERFLGEKCSVKTAPPKRRGNYTSTRAMKQTRKVAAYTKAGELLGVFDNCGKAARKTNNDADAIWKCCRGVTQSSKGLMYHFVTGEAPQRIAPYNTSQGKKKEI